MLDDVVGEKGQIIQRALRRARDEEAAAQDFESDYTHQDAAILNLQRACEAVIDLGNHLLWRLDLGPANKSRAIFEKLRDAGSIAPTLADKLIGIVGFRNVAVHAYTELDLKLVQRVIVEDSSDLLTFVEVAARLSQDQD